MGGEFRFWESVVRCSIVSVERGVVSGCDNEGDLVLRCWVCVDYEVEGAGLGAWVWMGWARILQQVPAVDCRVLEVGISAKMLSKNLECFYL
jgi:hypothetical protein